MTDTTILDAPTARAAVVDLEPQADQPVQLHRAAPQTTHAVVESGPEMLMRLAVERGDGDLDRLERLWQMQVQFNAASAKQQFIAAMAALKAEAIDIVKRKEVDFPNAKGGRTQYKHAELSDVIAAVVPALSKHGLAHRWDCDQKNGQMVVSCIVTHIAGHSERLTMEAPYDASGGKNAIQAIGSAKTYLERYTLLGILGLSTRSEDDDGQAAGKAEENATAILVTKILDEYRAKLDQTHTDHGCLALYKAALIALEATKDISAVNEWRTAVADRRRAIQAEVQL